jgi:hypothetical protein
MVQIPGWESRGLPLCDDAPYGHWKTLTFLAALRSDRIDASYVFDGPINGRGFLAYVEQLLVPTLSPGDVVILDNLGSHKGAATRQAIRMERRPLGRPLLLCHRIPPRTDASGNFVIALDDLHRLAHALLCQPHAHIAGLLAR